MQKQTTSNPVAAAIAIPGWIIAVLGFLGCIILGWFKGVTSKGVSGMLGMAAMSGFKGFVMTSPDRAIEWLKEASSVFRTPTVAWAVFVSDIMYTLTGSYIDASQFIKQGIGPGSRDTIQALGNAYLQPMLGLILPRGGESAVEMRLTPDDGVAAANRFFGVNLEFQMKAWLLHMLGDTFSFGMWKGMKDLPNAISWSFGIGWLSWLVMGTPFRMGIADPLEIKFNRIYRPWRMNIGQLVKSYWTGRIPSKTYFNEMRDWGVADPWMDVLLEQGRDKMSSSEVYSLYRKGKLTWQNLVDWQHAQGHSPEESLILATDMTRREVGDLITGVAKTAMKHYKDRKMDTGQLKSFLREALWTDEEANLIIQDLNMQMALEKPEEVAERVLTPANIARLYQLGEETRTWAEMMLTKRGFLAEEIPYFLKLYPPKVEKPP